MENHIVCQENNGVLEIQFNRPDKKNALTNAMYQQAQTAMEQAIDNDDIKVILFTAVGDFFTAGNDIADFIEISQSSDSKFNALDFVQCLGNYPKPIIASVTGSGVGIGTTLLLHCDLVYIVESAKLVTPFVNLGLVPEAGSSLLLTQRIGYNRAFEMFVLGEPMSAEEAVKLGIANQSFASSEEVLQTARQKAQILAKKPTQAVLQTKKLMRDSEMILQKMLQEGAYFSERLQSDEAKQILQQFLAKK